jgi:hypothetical protein
MSQFNLIALTVIVCASAFITDSLAAGKVDATYVNPDQYADLGYEKTDRERVLRTLDEHFRKMAERLPDGQTLVLLIGDVDLAGNLDFSMNRGQGPIRVFGGTNDGPRIRLQYQLMKGADVLKSGVVDLHNDKYFHNRRPTYLGNPELRFERRMLDDWMSSTILEP